jgi:hypothetical protein
MGIELCERILKFDDTIAPHEIIIDKLHSFQNIKLNPDDVCQSFRYNSNKRQSIGNFVKRMAAENKYVPVDGETFEVVLVDDGIYIDPRGRVLKKGKCDKCMYVNDFKLLPKDTTVKLDVNDYVISKFIPILAPYIIYRIDLQAITAGEVDIKVSIENAKKYLTNLWKDMNTNDARAIAKADAADIKKIHRSADEIIYNRMNELLDFDINSWVTCFNQFDKLRKRDIEKSIVNRYIKELKININTSKLLYISELVINVNTKLTFESEDMKYRTLRQEIIRLNDNQEDIANFYNAIKSLTQYNCDVCNILMKEIDLSISAPKRKVLIKAKVDNILNENIDFPNITSIIYGIQAIERILKNIAAII